MSEQTIVHLLRHGEVYNPDKVLYGRLPDFHLSELGREMAERIGEVLQRRDIALITSSPLDRAQETAAPLAARSARRGASAAGRAAETPCPAAAGRGGGPALGDAPRR